jgi:ATP-binding cassette subfamily B protein/subfamily B ATP-binding cassette protein MsbA
MVFFGERNSGVLPSLVTFVVALQRLNGTFGNLSQTLVQLKNNSANLDLLNSFLNDSDKQFRRRGGKSFVAIGRDIKLRNVSLRYSPELEPALTNINLTLPKGQTIALVGSSGAGKSSIADLLAGLYEPTKGEILVDGTNLATFDLVSWQQRLGVVSQDTFLFNATIAENIAFGTPGINRQDIEKVAEQAQAARFIRELPAGFETLVGERGYRMSGGEKQRLAIARLLLKDPAIMILDEATSHLDNENEAAVQVALEEALRGRTALVIAHRLSTVRHADRIVVLDAGHLLEEGTHEELMERNGLYAAQVRAGELGQ